MNINALLFVICISLAAGLATPSRAEVVTKCGEADGYTYFAAGALVPKNKAGWQQDRTSGGSFLLLRDGDTFDIIYSDSTKRTVSSREDGGQVIRISQTGNSIVLLVNYPNTLIEIWAFDLDSAGRGELTFHQAQRHVGKLSEMTSGKRKDTQVRWGQ